MTKAYSLAELAVGINRRISNYKRLRKAGLVVRRTSLLVKWKRLGLLNGLSLHNKEEMARLLPGQCAELSNE